MGSLDAVTVIHSAPWAGAAGTLTIEVLADEAAVALRAAAWIADAARESIAARGRFVLALSGGATPVPTLRRLAAQAVEWSKVDVVQVDERVVPSSSPDRNLSHLRDALIDRVPLPARQLHTMPVDDDDLAAAAARYGAELARVAGSPPLIDLVVLGLGADGHTASLVPGDAALQVTDADVALAGPYGGHHRMTLTFPVINRARRVLWLVTGADKAEALARLAEGDESAPASHVSRATALLLADRAAASLLSSMGS